MAAGNGNNLEMRYKTHKPWKHGENVIFIYFSGILAELYIYIYQKAKYK